MWSALATIQLHDRKSHPIFAELTNGSFRADRDRIRRTWHLSPASWRGSVRPVHLGNTPRSGFEPEHPARQAGIIDR